VGNCPNCVRKFEKKNTDTVSDKREDDDGDYYYYYHHHHHHHYGRGGFQEDRNMGHV
jgi:hypothetical protein